MPGRTTEAAAPLRRTYGLKAAALHSIHQGLFERLAAHCCTMPHLCLLHRQAHAGCLHAGHRQQRGLYCRGAGRAVHAPHLEPQQAHAMTGGVAAAHALAAAADHVCRKAAGLDCCHCGLRCAGCAVQPQGGRLAE